MVMNTSSHMQLAFDRREPVRFMEVPLHRDSFRLHWMIQFALSRISEIQICQSLLRWIVSMKSEKKTVVPDRTSIDNLRACYRCLRARFDVEVEVARQARCW